jgi:hypothetical protein
MKNLLSKLNILIQSSKLNTETSCTATLHGCRLHSVVAADGRLIEGIIEPCHPVETNPPYVDSE